MNELPDHLRDDAPYKQCTDCGRKSWEELTVKTRCQMPQPNGEKCKGLMLPPDWRGLNSGASE